MHAKGSKNMVKIHNTLGKQLYIFYSFATSVQLTLQKRTCMLNSPSSMRSNHPQRKMGDNEDDRATFNAICIGAVLLTSLKINPFEPKKSSTKKRKIIFPNLHFGVPAANFTGCTCSNVVWKVKYRKANQLE